MGETKHKPSPVAVTCNGRHYNVRVYGREMDVAAAEKLGNEILEKAKLAAEACEAAKNGGAA